jgi:hypothetical protein
LLIRSACDQGRVAIRTLIALFIVIIAASACTEAGVPQSDTSPTSHSALTEVDPGCSSVPTSYPCRSVSFGGSTYRYVLLRAGQPTTATLIVDFGGPGIALVAAPQTSIETFAKTEADLARSYNFLFIEEPWTQQGISDSCNHAASNYYETLRNRYSDVAGAANTLRISCNLGHGEWGFTAASYRTAISRIQAREHVTVRAFVGWSFGSVRWDYLSGWHLDWSVLLRPHPLLATGRQILQGRAVAAGRQITEAAKHSLVPMAPVELNSRSVPVTGFDQLSAVVHSAYLDDDAFSQSVLHGIALGTNPEAIGIFSDAVWGRYDVDSLAPSYLAQLDEGCVANGDWPRASGHLTSVYDLLAAFWAPCRSVAMASPGPGPTGPLCAVVSSADPVVPQSLLPWTFPAGRAHSVVAVSERQHSSDAGLPSCLRQVMASV